MTNVVITGANRGLGLALAKLYRAQGATVIGGCRNPATADQLRDSGAEVHQLDTGSGESIASFAGQIGDRPVDLLFNNAGIDARAVGADEAARSALDLTEAQFRSVMDVNVIGPVISTQAFGPLLGSVPSLRGPKGRIVMISSVSGKAGAPMTAPAAE